MATMRQVIDGLEILEKYDKSGYPSVCAEHDILYAGHEAEVSDEDRAKLDTLGWHYDDSVQSWARFT